MKTYTCKRGLTKLHCGHGSCMVRCNGTVLVAYCTCMAGLADTYSHVGVVLHWVEAAVQVCDETTYTSKDNNWLMPTSA